MHSRDLGKGGYWTSRFPANRNSLWAGDPGSNKEDPVCRLLGPRITGVVPHPKEETSGSNMLMPFCDLARQSDTGRTGEANFGVRESNHAWRLTAYTTLLCRVVDVVRHD
jgi:hypothetical protein